MLVAKEWLLSTLVANGLVDKEAEVDTHTRKHTRTHTR